MTRFVLDGAIIVMADDDAPVSASPRSQPAALADPASSKGNSTPGGSPRRLVTDDYCTSQFFSPRESGILTGSIMDEDEPWLQSDRSSRTSPVTD